ncbi:MAG: prenyltransferase/squalene oxidase repeat-containing protein [Kiritimatiellia bacterium]|nr:hypothetical protein [Lentisphaerota bacterium]
MSASSPAISSDLITTAAQASLLLSEAGRRKIADYLRSCLHQAGGFCDRAGRPDLYYTVFGLSGLLALEQPIPQADRIRSFLESCGNPRNMSFVELISLIRCHHLLDAAGHPTPLSETRLQAIINRIGQYRCQDGGFAHDGIHSEHSTLYALFLIEQALRDLGQAAMIPADPADLIARLATPDGGYANHVGAGQGIATASATAALLLAGQGRTRAAQNAVTFLESLRAPNGGYRASAATSLPDILATATALYARARAGWPAPDGIDADAAFIERLWSDAGGFCGHPADAQPDVEYTFYALLALGAIKRLHHDPTP